MAALVDRVGKRNAALRTADVHFTCDTIRNSESDILGAELKGKAGHSLISSLWFLIATRIIYQLENAITQIKQQAYQDLLTFMISHV